MGGKTGVRGCWKVRGLYVVTQCVVWTLPASWTPGVSVPCELGLVWQNTGNAIVSSDVTPETFISCLWLALLRADLGFQAAGPVAGVTSRGRTARDYLGHAYKAYD